jgi:phosphatidylglycerol lysyltransferase
MNKKSWQNIGFIISAVLFGAAIYVIHIKLRKYHYHDIVRQLLQVPFKVLIFAAVLTICDYLVLTIYDVLALRYIQHRLEYRRIAMASFIGYVFSHNATIVGGSAARYRIYSAFGISANEVAKLVVFCSLTFWLGFLTISGTAFVLARQDIPEAFHIPFVSVLPVGIIFLTIVIAYIMSTVFRNRPLRLGGWELPIPPLSLSLGQIGISSLDWLLAGSVLYVLLPDTMQITFFKFIVIFLLAQIAGLLSYIPGGLGVFETVILLLLSEFGEPSAVMSSLLLYRLIYYIIPLGIASIILAVYEVLSRKEALAQVGVAVGRWSSALVPHVLAFTSFVAGAILLFSGALPTAGGRLAWLRHVLPLPAIEISHFLGSLVGAGLLILARGLQKRLDAAYHLTIVLLVAGIVFAFLRGLEYEEAIVLAVMLLALLGCRRQFYIKASITSERFTPAWIVLIGVVLLCSVWIGFFSYKHIAYSNQLWWRFTLNGDAPRFLRATAGVIIIIFLFAMAKLLVPAKPKPAVPGVSELEKVKTIVGNSRKTYAWLALLGDKKFLFNEKQDAFIMYGVEGRSWVAMGDPVGAQDQWEQLLWSFRELCDQYGGWPVFYQIETSRLDLYLDLGMTFLKLGEEAHVPLSSFSLEGAHRKGLRSSHNKIQSEGCTFEIIPSSDVPQFFSELKNVSDAWLADKSTREKRFSIGFFNPDYLSLTPVAVVRSHGKVIAFANVLTGAEKEELSVDLMRFLPDAPNGLMDFLFIEIMLWGKSDGFKWFNFGMAPLSGFEDHALAPLWSRVGAFVFMHGEHFYNFQGLRQYKEKFDPKWQPKFLACQKGLILPRILTNIATLISGGVKGVVAK